MIDSQHRVPQISKQFSRYRGFQKIFEKLFGGQETLRQMKSRQKVYMIYVLTLKSLGPPGQRVRAIAYGGHSHNSHSSSATRKLAEADEVIEILR